MDAQKYSVSAGEIRPTGTISYAIEVNVNTAKLLSELRMKILAHRNHLFGESYDEAVKDAREVAEPFGLLPRLRESTERLEDEAMNLAQTIESFLSPVL